jgi:hypothetical protein
MVDNHFTRQYNPEDSSEHDPQLVFTILKQDAYTVHTDTHKHVYFCLTFAEIRTPTLDTGLRAGVHTSSKTRPASYPMGTGVLSRGQPRPGRDDHSTTSGVEVKNEQELTSSPP